LLPCLSGASEIAELRVAAILASVDDPKALVESDGGEQRWYQVGDALGGATITAIASHEVLLEGPDGSFRLPLRGDPQRVTDVATAETTVPSRHQAKEFQFLGLLSQINSVDQAAGESYEDAAARTLNSAIGLGPDARITAVGRVEVTSAEEAQQELQRQLGAMEGPVRITLENDELEDLYLMPQ